MYGLCFLLPINGLFNDGVTGHAIEVRTAPSCLAHQDIEFIYHIQSIVCNVKLLVTVNTSVLNVLKF